MSNTKTVCVCPNCECQNGKPCNCGPACSCKKSSFASLRRIPLFLESDLGQTTD
jgi:hypothetical protein